MSKFVQKIFNFNLFEFVKNVKELISMYKIDEVFVNLMKFLGFNENLWGLLNLGNVIYYCYFKII